MNRKSVIKFEDVDDENEDEEREVRTFSLCVRSVRSGNPPSVLRNLSGWMLGGNLWSSQSQSAILLCIFGS